MEKKSEAWIKNYVEVWSLGYSKLPESMKDESAKASAMNGMMIAADRKGLLSVEFDPRSAPPAEKAQNPAPAADRGQSLGTPEQKAEMDRLAALHGKDPLAAELNAKAAYDPTEKRWHTCTCGNTDIENTSTGGRKYQACGTCKLYLNADGTVKPFKTAQTRMG
jgi:hypothetical protein